MKIETAKEIAKLVDEIREEKNQLERFGKTKEFCNIYIKGENGAECEYSFMIGHKLHRIEVKLIRDFVEDVIKSRIAELDNILEQH